MIDPAHDYCTFGDLTLTTKLDSDEKLQVEIDSATAGTQITREEALGVVATLTTAFLFTPTEIAEKMHDMGVLE